eukprot:7250952-Karenia_brevis.AAC.1
MMVSGADELAAPVAQPQVYGATLTHTSQKPRGRQYRETKKMNKGLRICSVNITSSSKKATWWLARLPYDI